MRCIDLITVVLAGVVRSRDHDTRRGVQIAGRKRHSRHRHQDGPDIDLDAIGREHSGGHFCKHIALDAAVIADGHGRLCKVLFQIIGQALRGLCHSIDVHAVGACADDAAQTARAKGQVAVKAVVDGIGISPDAVQFGEQVRILHCAGVRTARYLSFPRYCCIQFFICLICSGDRYLESCISPQLPTSIPWKINTECFMLLSIFPICVRCSIT